MKLSFKSFIYLFLFGAVLNAQTTIELTSNQVQDALIRSLTPDQLYGDHPDFNAHAWTNQGSPVTHRSLMNFDLSAIPQGAIIESAQLSLYSYESPANGKHSRRDGSNRVEFLKITENWNHNTVTWNTQPATGSQFYTWESNSDDIEHLENIDITDLIQEKISNSSSNYGFMMKLIIEDYYRGVLFASADNPDELIRPKVTITYTLPNDELIINSDKIKDALIRDLSPDLNYGDHPDFNAHAWTNQGNPVIHRSLMNFDLSAIPEGSVIESAQLSLYSYESPANGKHSRRDGSNRVEFLKVTEDWNPNTVTWNTQPSTSDQFFTWESTSDEIEDLENIDVTDLIQEKVSNSSSNYGFMMKLILEDYYRGVLFASADNSDSLIRPILKIKFADNNTDTNEILGCKDPLSYNYNPNATIDNGSCEYDSLNLNDDDDLTNIGDTIGTDPVISCELDFNSPINAILISNFSIVGDSIILTWEIHQGNQVFFIDVSYFTNINTGKVLFTLSLKCNLVNLASKTPESFVYKTFGKVLDLNVLNSEAIENSSVSIFPNPVKDILFIDSERNGTASLYDTNGKLVATRSIFENDRNSINVSNLSSGFYILNIQFLNQIQTVKVIKQ